MTVIELRKRLEQFDDNLVVMIPNIKWEPNLIAPTIVPAESIAKGVNEFDNCLLISDYEEDNDND